MTVLLVVLLGAVVFVALVWAMQRRLIYLPAGVAPSARTVLPGAEDVTFETHDGLQLSGWFLPSRDPGERRAVVVFNGNAGNRTYRAPLADALSDAGLSVLLVDYRGYGGNPGTPTEDGLLADARAAAGYLASRPEVDPARIVYFGESLGAAVAVALAAERPPAALVLRSPFATLSDVGSHHYPYLPVALLLRDRYAAVDRIGSVSAPILVIAAEHDVIVPVSHSRRLFEAASEPKRIVVIPGADHNDLEMLAGERLIREVVAFVRAAE